MSSLRPPTPSAQDSQATGSLIWKAIKSGAGRLGIGTAAVALAPKLAPRSVGALLEPMSPLATRFAPLGPAVRAIGRFGTRVGPLAPLTIVALNPTNRIPNSSVEQRMGTMHSMEVFRQQETIRRRNEDTMRNLAFQRQQDAQRRNRLQLTPPRLPTFNPIPRAPTFSPISRTNQVMQQRLEPVRLRPALKIGTPFNMRLLRPSPVVRNNPFGLSVMGRQSTGGPFGMNLGSPQLRAPMIGR